MNVILVYVHKAISPFRPLGLLYVAACLEREGHKVHVIDPRPSDPVTKIFEATLGYAPDVIGFSCLTPDMPRALSIADGIKKRWQGPMVFGGVHPTVCLDETLEHECVDYVVIGEGEETICELCKNLSTNESVGDIKGIGYKKDGRMCIAPPRPLIQNLDNLPLPARHLMPSRWYNSPKIRGLSTKSTEIVITGRGCPWSCIFCSSHLMWSRKVRQRSPQNVVQELEHLRVKYGIKSFWFVDDTFTMDRDWVNDFCNLIKQQKWRDLAWACQARVDTVNSEMLRQMKNAGCVQVEYGVESGSEKVLKILQKRISTDLVKNAFRMTKELGLRALATFIMDVPGETLNDIEATERIIQEIQPDHFQVYFAIPYPGTRLRDLAEGLGINIKSVPYDRLMVGEIGESARPIMCSTLIEQELVKLRERLLAKQPRLNFWTMFQQPGFIRKGGYILAKGFSGIPYGLKGFLMTRRIGSLTEEIYKAYLNKEQPRLE